MVDYATPIVSGLIAFITTWLVNSWLRNRQEAFEILKIISSAAPFYIQLSRNAWNFSWGLTHPTDDAHYYKQLMYRICNVMYIKSRIDEKFGDLQFDNLRAERVIGGIGGNFFSVIANKFSALEYSEMAYLVENNIPYHKFHDRITSDSNGKQLFDKFQQWLSKEIGDEDRKTLEKNCGWYAQLITLELNHIYKIIYVEEPPLILQTDLAEYLIEHESEYYKRIHSFAQRLRSETE